jgi:hypothetical protein
MHKRAALVAAAAALVIGAAACGASTSSSSGGQATKSSSPSAPEVNPPGDIPDDQAYVKFTPPGAGFSVKVPEGWSRTTMGGETVFTDKLNAIRIERQAARAPLSAGAAKRIEMPKLAKSVNGFQAGSVSTVARQAGSAVRITYLATAKPNAVTGKAGQNAVERYVFFHNGEDVILTLSGPKGADNVDPWKIVTDSVTWSR